MTAAGVAIAAMASPVAAQGVSVEQVLIPGPSLEGNLEGNDATRDIIVYLPPSYATDEDRRYPVVYALHGYSANNEAFRADLARTDAVASAFAGGAQEMIVVMPDAQTLHNGSMYTASVTVGDWESYIAEDVVSYVDANYRTVATRDARGLAGHSMGGYGTLRIGMKRPDVFAALYAMSPCCLEPSRGVDPAMLEKLRGYDDPADTLELGFFERATLASAAAWSPNPENPPFYFDLPGDDAVTDPVARWTANAPLAMADQYRAALDSYEAIAIDIGDEDWLLPGAKKMNEWLTLNGIEHDFEIYEGDHVNRVSEQFRDKVLPFFSQALTAE
ncbi:esterase [Aquisalinus flavus]|uniref:Esterase n=2 Tax=Aquisalinus flavus TaxID=1526572 RepID=A0A8J2V6P5_9PROT|nr:esterase [Aquisalinus flavus]